MKQNYSLVIVLTLFVAGAALVSVRAQPAKSGVYQQKSRTFHTAADFARITGGNVAIRRTVDPGQELALRREAGQLPVADVTVIANESDSIVWAGSSRGAFRFNRQTTSREYFAGQRWLPDDRVIGIGFEAGSAAWIETPAGFARIKYTPWLLSDKSRAFVERIRERHNRWGFTASSELRTAGDPSTNRMISTDNDGLWTAMYVAAESFRYKVTGDRDARDNARKGMEAILRLETITGIPGFPARSIIKVGEDVQPKDGEWHDTPDKVWRWKGDTSSDEIVGHYFVVPIYLDLVADESEKPALRGFIDRMTSHILDHNYQLTDVDGQRTRWGWWGPDAIWDDPDETGLRALHILAHLRVALHVTSNAEFQRKYQAAYDNLLNVHRYHLLTRNQKVMVPGHINHSDDELAFLSYYPLLQYEKDPALLEVYKYSLQRSWEIERPERNPLWNFVYAAGTEAKEFDQSESVRTLREIPLDMVQWTVSNSHRLDVPIDALADRFKRRQSLAVLPYDELPMSKWNGNPYSLDGGTGGRSEDDGAYFLLPYWMGRYHRLIGE